jgi:cytoplasmic iron level regulating protein YaaA (DUF328/UPF0246 family)
LLGESLYDYWSEMVTERLNVMAREANAKYILNLASQEYFGVVDVNNLAVPLINVEFKTQTPTGLRIIAIHAKRARGYMARFVLDNEIDNPERLKEFKENGYVFDPLLSSAGNLVFVSGRV